MYKIYWIAGVVLLSGCASAPANNWGGLETETERATEPLKCVMPLPDEVVGQSIVYETAHDLEAYRVCSEANASIASEHVDQISELKVVRKGLTEAGQAQERISNMKSEIIEEERKHHFWTSLGQWVLIIGMGIAL